MGKVAPFITGAALGAIAALAFSPSNGEQNRALAAEKANALVGEAKDFVAGAPDSVQEVYSSLRSQGEAFVKDAQSMADGFVADASTRVKEVAGKAEAPAAADDELRAKIEAARQRIAAQVMENAAQSKALDITAEPEPEAELAKDEPAAEEAAE